MSKRFISRFLLAVIGVLVFASCEYKELCYDHDHQPKAKISLNFDWSDIAEDPSGVTAMFYPTNGGAPLTFITNSYEKFEVSLPEGEYNILVFNQTVDEYDSFTFHNMDSWDDMYIELADSPRPSWNNREGGFSREPSDLVVGTKQNFGVTAFMVNSSDGNPVVVELHPHPILLNTEIKVHVDGIQYARQARGVISGMAKTYSLSKNCTGSETTNFTLQNWAIVRDDEMSTQGSLETSFISFGLPNTQYTEEELQLKRNKSKSTKATVNLTDKVILDMDVLLVDNESVVSKSFNVTDRIMLEMARLTLKLDIGIPIPGSDDPEANIPWELPFAEDPDSSKGGFDVTVDEWGEEEVHDIDM